MTIPSLIAKHQKKVVITRLQKFYTVINQAYRSSIAEYGGSDAMLSEIPTDKNAQATLDWYNEYLSKYIKTISVNKTADGIVAAMPDGSGFGLYQSHIYFCTEYKYCTNVLKQNNNRGELLYVLYLDGKYLFGLNFEKNTINTYSNCWSGTREDLIHHPVTECGWDENYGCGDSYHKYCAKLIEYDGWEIRDDYPIKF